MPLILFSRDALHAWSLLIVGFLLTAGLSQRWWLELDQASVGFHPTITWAGTICGLLISGLAFSLALMRVHHASQLRRMATEHAREIRVGQRKHQATQVQLRAALEAIPDLLFEVDLDGRYRAYHAPFVDLEDAPSGFPLTQTLRATLLPESADTCMAAIQEAHATGKSQGSYIRIQVPQGSRWFELSISRKRQSAGSGPRFIVLLKDETERRRAWLILQRSHAMQNTIFDTLRQGLVAMTEAGIITQASRSSQRLLGISAEQAKGRVAAGLLHSLQPLAPLGSKALPTLPPMVGLRGLLAEARQGRAGVSEWMIGHSNGSSFPAELELVRMEDGVSGFLLSITDISERRRSKASLVAATRLAQNANDAKSRFLAAASHDLRQPLSALSLYVGLLKARTLPEHGELMHSIQDCVDSLTALLNDLLDISKLEAGVVKPDVADFAIDGLLTALASVHRGQAQAKGLRIRLRPSGQTTRTDRVLLQRVVGNFVDNALRYTTKGGVLIACRARQGKWWVEVWDSGMGIPEDKQAQVFEEFRSLGPNTEDRGSGLGLAIAVKMAGLLGLEIQLASRPGRGSRFAIEVPLGAPLRVDGSQARLLKADRLRIALVDDHPQLLRALTLALEAEGYEVIAAPDQQAMIERLSATSPDLLLTDHRLAGGETGFDLIEAARAAVGSTLPAIIMTGDTDPGLIREMAGRGIKVHYKPIQLAALKADIQEAVKRDNP
jgi:signal transduction histidine kinase/CheY-like chemotaxis protein